MTQKKRNGSWIYILPLLLLWVSLSACRSPQKNTNNEITANKAVISKIITIPLFYNATLEPLLERELTRIFKETFYTQGWQIENKHTEEKQLTGKITGFSVTPSALSLTGGARAYQMKILMDIQVIQGAKEGVILKTKLEGISDYTARPDSAADRTAKNRAIREAAREMAERAVAFLALPLSEKK